VPPPPATRSLPANPICSGGLELLFSNQRTHKLQLPAVDPSTTSATTIAYLVGHLATLMADSRKELFVVDGTVYAPLPLLSRYRRRGSAETAEDGRGYWYSLMMPTGSSRGRRGISYSRGIRCYLCPLCMVGRIHECLHGGVVECNLITDRHPLRTAGSVQSRYAAPTLAAIV